MLHECYVQILRQLNHQEQSISDRAIISRCSPDDNAIGKLQSHGQTADKLVRIVDAADSCQFLFDIAVHVVSACSQQRIEMRKLGVKDWEEGKG